MKKVVVVVGRTEDGLPIKEFFEGEKLHINDPAQSGNIQFPCLTIFDDDKELAAFRKWQYWRKIA